MCNTSERICREKALHFEKMVGCGEGSGQHPDAQGLIMLMVNKSRAMDKKPVTEQLKENEYSWYIALFRHITAVDPSSIQMFFRGHA